MKIKLVSTIISTALMFSVVTVYAGGLSQGLLLTNKGKETVTIYYNSGGQPQTLAASPNQFVAAGENQFPSNNEFKITKITDGNSAYPFEDCPVLNFNQQYTKVAVTIGPNGKCSAEVEPFK